MQFLVEAGVFPKICIINNREEGRMLDSDASLMLAFQSGDIFSFEKLAKRYKEKVINIIYQFIGERNEAEDLAIEVFLRVYQAARSYQAKGKFTTWLYKITINLCLDQKRKKERLKIISLSQPISTKEEKEEELIEEIPDSAPSPWEILQKKNKMH